MMKGYSFVPSPAANLVGVVKEVTAGKEALKGVIFKVLRLYREFNI